MSDPIRDRVDENLKHLTSAVARKGVAMSETKPVAWHIPRSISVTKDHDVTDRWRLGNPDTVIEPLYPASAITSLMEENERLKARVEELEAAKWQQRHIDTANDLVSMGMARDAAEARAQAAEQKLADAVKVLEPFADEAHWWEGYHEQERIVEGFPGYEGEVRVCHLRAARRFIKEAGE